MANDWRNGLAKRVRDEEVRASILAPDSFTTGVNNPPDPASGARTKTDRISLGKRLQSLEVARSITGNASKGVENRLKAIEAA